MREKFDFEGAIGLIVMSLFILIVIVFFNGCGSIVYADSEYKYGEVDFSFEDLTSRFINGEDDSDGVEYYKEYEEENSVSTFSLSSTDGDDYEDTLRESNFFDYPYWVFYLDKVYASNYPFAFGGDNNNLLYSYDFSNNFNIVFDSYKLGVSTGMYNLHVVDIRSNLHSSIISNHDIVYLSGDIDNIEGIEGVDSYSVPDYSVADFPYMMKFGYYTIISKHPLYLQYDSDSETIEGLYQTRALIANSSNFDTVRYSYLGSEFTRAPDRLFSHRPGATAYYRIGFEFEEPYPSYDNFLFFVVSINYDVDYANGGYTQSLEYYDSFFEFSNPPSDWSSFSPEYVYPPGESPVDGEDPVDEGSILDWLNPFSDKFLLKVAFVPSDDFFPNEIENLISKNESLFDTFGHVSDSLKQVFDTGFGTSKFNGIEYGDKVLSLGTRHIYVNGLGSPIPSSCKNPVKIGGSLIGTEYRCSILDFDLSDYKLVDASYIAEFISKFRYWVGAVLQLLFMIWLLQWLLSFFGYHSPSGGIGSGSDDKK